jgi:hypothetical protein
VRRGCVSATGGGHLKYYINWLGKCSTPQTPSNRSFSTPKKGHFRGGPQGSLFLDFFSNFFKNFRKFKFHDFCLTLDLFEHSYVAVTCITLECYLPPLMTVDYAHSTPSLNAVVPSPCVYHVHPSTLTRKTTSDPITPHFSFTRSSHSNACLLRATADTRSCPTGGCTPTYFICMKRFARGPRSHSWSFQILI